MPRSASPKTALARMLDRATVPAFAVDDSRRIVYCNRSLASRLGYQAEQFLGVSCAYHSEETLAGGGGLNDPFQQVACGLCPPSEAFEQPYFVGSILLPLNGASAQGPPESMSAVFCRFVDDANELLGVVVFVYDVLPQEDQDPLAAESLHGQIARLRSQMRSEFQTRHLVGDSMTMRRIRHQIQLVSTSAASVLIVGGPGTGKEHIGRTIHVAGDRNQEALILPIDSKVADHDSFGTVLDTFLKRARNVDRAISTVLLLGAQGLSDALQTEIMQRIRHAPRNVRWIATASHDLRQAAGANPFSQELAESLATVMIHVPNLRDRREDIPLLAQYLVEHSNAAVEHPDAPDAAKQVQLTGFTEQAMERLLAYDWPRNVDELKECVAEAIAVCDPPKIVESHLPRRLAYAMDATVNPPDGATHFDLDAFLAATERKLITEALARSRGNKSKAAKMLHVSRAKLLRRINHLDIPTDPQ